MSPDLESRVESLEIEVDRLKLAVAELRGHQGDVLDIRATAELVGVSTRTVRKWVRDGRLRPLRLSTRTVRFLRSDLLDALRAGLPTEGAER